MSSAPPSVAPRTAVPSPATPDDGSGVTPPSQRGRSVRRIGEVVVDLGFATADRVNAAVEAARASGRTTGKMLVEIGAITPDQLARVVAERFGLDHVDLTVFKVDMGAANRIGPDVARRYGALPIGYVNGRTLLVAMADPANILALDDIAMITGLEVAPAIATAPDIEILISRLSRFEGVMHDAIEEGGDDAEEITDLDEASDDAPIIRLVHSIIAQAIDQGASDIHLAPTEGELHGLFRVDGVLSPSVTVPRRMVPGVISRIKIMADLDISERRAPQDGRIGLTIDKRPVDIRVVTLPLVGGESVVMRILDRRTAALSLDDLGMLEHERTRFERACKQTYGAVLVTGPTGSGKSTSLYGALKLLNSGDRSIITIEDPVEYKIDGLRQMQVNPKAGVTFATGLRSMMRADPDVVMVGEIRDRETAQIAVEAALTGHLVLSTLHTNDAPSAVTRLIEMGIEPFLVSSALKCVVAQRLVRNLCPACKREHIIPADLVRDSGWKVEDDVQAYEPVGCGRCGQTGYKGRSGLFEVMPVSDEIRSLALQRRSAEEIAEVAEREGMRRLRDDGLEKIRLGITSIHEVLRVAGVN